jgi:sucrose phosphorylase
MDAFAYTTIEIGTNCFFLEPQVWRLLEWLNEYLTPFDTTMLPEVHEHYRYHRKIANKGYWTYDFALPMLVLHTLYHHTSEAPGGVAADLPAQAVHHLDTHDGIGVVDVEDLLTPEEIERTLEGLDEKGSNTRKLYSGPEYQNLDVYQVNCTYYSALECNDDSYLAARTIQFFAPGHPASLLRGAAGRRKRYRAGGGHPQRPRHQSSQLQPGRNSEHLRLGNHLLRPYPA